MAGLFCSYTRLVCSYEIKSNGNFHQKRIHQSKFCEVFSFSPKANRGRLLTPSLIFMLILILRAVVFDLRRGRIISKTSNNNNKKMRIKLQEQITASHLLLARMCKHLRHGRDVPFLHNQRFGENCLIAYFAPSIIPPLKLEKPFFAAKRLVCVGVFSRFQHQFC